MVLKATFQEQSSKQSLLKVSLKKYLFQKSIAELWTVIPSQVIKYSLPIRSSIKLVIINMTCTYMESYPPSY